MAETKKKKQDGIALPIGTILRDGDNLYRIEEVLKIRGSSIVYRASLDVVLDNITLTLDLAIIEYFKNNVCWRDDDFCTMYYPMEMRYNLSLELKYFKSRGQELINRNKEYKSEDEYSVLSVFEENNTVYYVSDIDNDKNKYFEDFGTYAEPLPHGHIIEDNEEIFR